MFLFLELVERHRDTIEQPSSPLLVHPLHHFSHFHELLNKAIDLGDRRAAPIRDSASSTPVQDSWVTLLADRHGVDNGLHSLELSICLAHIHLLAQFSTPRDKINQLTDGAHFSHRLKLRFKVLQGERMFFG